MNINQTGTVSTTALAEPITLADVEAQTRIESLSDESLAVELFIRAVRQRAEAITRRGLVRKTEKLILDAFPLGGAKISLNKPPLVSVESVTYTDTAGVVQTLATSAYTVNIDAEPGYILPVYGTTWPYTLSHPDSVTINYTCGYAFGTVPEAIRAWMLMNVASLYENRETVIVGKNSLVEISTLADALLDDFRVRSF